MTLQSEISAWAKETFGPSDPLTMLRRMRGEVLELKEAIVAGHSSHVVAEECADVLHFLFQISEAVGVDLIRATERKFEKNKARNWELNGDGTGQHVSDPREVDGPITAQEMYDTLGISDKTVAEARKFIDKE